MLPNSPGSVRAGRIAILAALVAVFSCDDDGFDPSLHSLELLVPQIQAGTLVLREGQSVTVESRVSATELDASDVQLTVRPASIGTITGTTFQAGLAGEGWIIGRLEELSDSLPVRVLLNPEGLERAGDFPSEARVGGLIRDLAVRVVGRDDLPVPDIAVQFQVVSGGGSVSTRSTFSDTEGVARTDFFVGSAAGEQVVRASAEGLQVDIGVTAVADESTAGVSTVTSSKPVGVVGRQTTLTVRAEDAFGNPVAGLGVVWTFSAGTASVSGSSAAAALRSAESTLSDETDANGESSVDWTLPSEAGSYTAEASIGGGGGSVGFTAQAEAGDLATIDVQPSDVALRVDESVQLSAELSDEFGNSVEGSPTWSASPGGVVEVDQNGVVTAVASGEADVTAALDGVSGVARVSVSGGTPTEAVGASGDGQTGTVGSALPEPLEVRVLDELGLPVEGVAVDFSTPDGGTLAPAAGTGAVSGEARAQVVMTDASGIARAEWTLGPTAGMQQAIASIPGLPDVGFMADAAPGPLVDIELVPLELTLQVNQSAAFTATPTDGFGNPLSGDPTWSASPAGIVSVTQDGSVTGLVPGQAQVSAAIGGVAGSAPVTVTAGPPAQALLVSGDGQSGQAGAPLPSPLVIEVLDGSGNPISGVPVDFATPGGGTLLPATPITDGSGRASSQWTLGGTLGEQSASATVSGLPPIGFTATAGPGDPATIELQPMSAITVRTGQTQRVLATVTDGFGNVIPDPDLTWSVANGLVAGIDQTGVVTGQAPGTTTASATASNGVSASVGVVVLASDPSQIAIVSGDAQITNVGTAYPQSLVVEVLDASNFPVPGVTVSFTGDGSFAPGSPSTGTDGRASTTWTAGLVAGVQTATATVAGVGSVDFTGNAVSGAGVPATLLLSGGDGQTTQVDQPFPANLQVEVQDGSGNPVPGVNVNFATPDGGSFSDPQPLTDVTGVASTQWRAGTTAGQQMATASLGSLTPVDFTGTATPGPAASVTVTPDPVTIPIANPRAMNLAAEDQFGNAIAGPSANWNSTDTNIFTVDGTGQVTGVSVGSADVEAMVDGVTGSATVNVLVTANKSGGDNQALQAGEPSPQPVQVSVLDNGGAPVQNVPVSFATPDGGSFSPDPASTDATGIASTTWTPGGGLGAQEATATVPGLPPLTFNANVGPGLPVSLTITGGPVDITVLDAPVDLDVSGEDQFTNPIASPSGTWSSSDDNIFTIDPATGEVTPVAPGSETATFTADNGVSESVTVDISPGPPDALVKFGGDNQNIPAGEPSPDPIEVRVVDQLGFGVPGETVTFSTPANGSFSQTNVVTDANGVASSSWIAGGTLGAITATATSGALPSVTFDATVTVGPAVTLDVTPVVVNLQPGQQQQLTAQGVDQFGNAGAVATTWSSGNTMAATVSGSGLVTAAAGGDGLVSVVTAVSGSLSRRVTVIVGTDTWPNEPAGLVNLTSRPFSGPRCSSKCTSGAATGWVDFDPGSNSKYTVGETDNTAPLGDGLVSQHFYPGGSGGPSQTVGGGFNTFPDIPGGTQQVYVGMWLKFSDPWDEHVSGTSPKIVFLIERNSTGGGNPLFLQRRPSGALRGSIQDVVAPNREMVENVNVGAVQVNPGEWHRVEFLAVISSGALVADGEFHMWVDGVKTHEYTDVAWSGNTVPAWAKFDMNPLWGGQGDVLQFDQFLWFDHVYISAN